MFFKNVTIKFLLSPVVFLQRGDVERGEEEEEEETSTRLDAVGAAAGPPCGKQRYFS
jgi:hypothetical protein